jgi:hypothetical protein
MKGHCRVWVILLRLNAHHGAQSNPPLQRLKLKGNEMDIEAMATSSPPTGLPPTPPGWDWSRKGYLTRRFGKLRLTVVENRMRPGCWTIALCSGAGGPHFFSTPYPGADEARFAAEEFGFELGGRHD